MIHKILRRFVDILTVNDKHHLLNRDNLMEPIKMQLSQTQKNFNELCFPFSRPILNFKHSPIKDHRHS